MDMSRAEMAGIASKQTRHAVITTTGSNIYEMEAAALLHFSGLFMVANTEIQISQTGPARRTGDVIVTGEAGPIGGQWECEFHGWLR